MGDYDIRLLLIELLLSQSKRNSDSILEEVAVSKGSVRADVVYAHDKLECYEIKSESDSLRRLLKQGWHYGRAFKLITLVAATKHISPSVEVIPDWWGIIEAESSGNLKVIRKAKPNPNQITFGLSELLTSQEALSLLEEIKQFKIPRNQSVRAMHEKVSKLYSLESLNDKVLSVFKERKKDKKTMPLSCLPLSI